MNNNKKYKKWSLGLVAPALVLAPIAVVASCSSSSDDTKIDLTKLVYTIALKDNNTNPQEIQLSDESTNSVDTITNEKLIDLVLTSDNKTNILNITGADATKINDDVLKKQILSIDGEPTKDKSNGKITFTLKVSNPTNGSGEALTKEITFAGFKQETDSTTPTEAYTIAFNAKDTDSKYALTTVAQKTTEDYSTIETIKPLVIAEKSVIFKATKGELPSDNAWWENNLVISSPSADPAKGEITITIQLNKSDSSDESANIKEENVVLKGFKKKPAAPTTGDETTVMTTEISTVTLGLNGTVAEAGTDVNAKWVLDHKRLLFTKGSNLIQAEADIKEVTLTATTPNTKANLKFKVVANKWFQADGSLGTTEKEFTIKIMDFSANNTNQTVLKLKSSNPLNIGLVDPELGKGTYDEFKNKKDVIFTKGFLFEYRKNLLTGDFSQIVTEDDLVKGDITVTTNDGEKSIQVDFTIPKEKVVPAAQSDVAITIKFNGFATN